MKLHQNQTAAPAWLRHPLAELGSTAGQEGDLALLLELPSVLGDE